MGRSFCRRDVTKVYISMIHMQTKTGLLNSFIFCDILLCCYMALNFVIRYICRGADKQMNPSNWTKIDTESFASVVTW